ncbi:MAG: TetR/AcrR family transcriptional regulator [Gammaproteobacteria bacterium]|nr:TetR/AcrR family transcriptional regulator [Gammaproteobacteria bacterium]MBV9697229.1 TetR/AcrR family transcriptional regulator [Gammaproteobacteria bacterium]
MINQVPDTRTRLVLTAMQLFWEKGYGSTSVADVLKVAGVNSGSLYHFFPGKQDLLLAVLDMYLAGIRDMLLEPAWRDVTDPIERVFALLARYRQSLADTECFYGCPIGSLALELHEPDLPVRERLAANFSAWRAAIHECLERAGARLPARLDRGELAGFVLTVMEGAVMQARTYRGLESFDGAVRQLRSYFERLLREGAAHARPGARARPRPRSRPKKKESR